MLSYMGLSGGDGGNWTPVCSFSSSICRVNRAI